MIHIFITIKIVHTYRNKDSRFQIYNFLKEKNVIFYFLFIFIYIYICHNI